MPVPGSTFNILDGTLAIAQGGKAVPHVFGVCDTGTANVPTVIGNVRQLINTFGSSGPAIDAAAYLLAVAGGNIVFTRATASTVAIISAITKNGSGPTITDNSSSAKNTYNAILTITKGGTLTNAKYKYSLDGGRTQSPEFTSAASISLTGTGIALTMAAGTYVLGDTYTFTTQEPCYNSTNLAAFFTAATASTLKWDFFFFAGNPQDTDDSAGLFATIETQMIAYSVVERFYNAIINAGQNTAASCLTDYASTFGVRTSVFYGTYDAPSQVTLLGRGFVAYPMSTWVASLQTGNVISTDLAQTSGAQSVGSIVGALAISQDEYANPAGLNDAKIGAARTYPNLTGFYLMNGWIRSPSGSNFEFIQHRRIMDLASSIASAQQALLIGRPYACKTDGTGNLTERSAQSIEKFVQVALDAGVGSANRGVGPVNIQGTKGHCSDILYQVDRTNNALSTKTVIATITIVPFAYPKFFTTTLSFSASLQ